MHPDHKSWPISEKVACKIHRTTKYIFVAEIISVMSKFVCIKRKCSCKYNGFQSYQNKFEIR